MYYLCYCMNSEIQHLRSKIDALDNELIKLVLDRLAITDKLIALKVKDNFTVDDFRREEMIVSRLADEFGTRISTSAIKTLYKALFTISKDKFKEQADFLTPTERLKLRPIIIAGPCAVESFEQIEQISSDLKHLGIRFLRGGAFKPRTSPNDFQGLGSKGLDLLLDAACRNGMFTVAEVLDLSQLEENYDKIDVIQIGSRNMSSYGFLKQVARVTAVDNKPIIIKRGFSATLKEFLYAADYLRSEGNPNIVLCLRGVRTFEQIDSKLRFTPDIGAIPELKERTELPVIFDPSHSVGDAKFVIPIAKAALAAGADGLMIECHHDPKNAIIDGFQAILPSHIKDILDE